VGHHDGDAAAPRQPPRLQPGAEGSRHGVELAIAHRPAHRGEGRPVTVASAGGHQEVADRRIGERADLGGNAFRVALEPSAAFAPLSPPVPCGPAAVRPFPVLTAPLSAGPAAAFPLAFPADFAKSTSLGSGFALPPALSGSLVSPACRHPGYYCHWRETSKPV